jgi:predicted DNA-binding antitoxin AbrB/MazE fold protein
MIVKTRAIYRNGVLKPDVDLDLPDGSTVEVEISSLPSTAIDPKDALLDDIDALHAMYTEFAEEDRNLAQLGLTHYAQVLNREETSQ